VVYDISDESFFPFKRLLSLKPGRPFTKMPDHSSIENFNSQALRMGG
jgi:hypothetical protein